MTFMEHRVSLEAVSLALATLTQETTGLHKSITVALVQASIAKLVKLVRNRPHLVKAV